MDAASGVLRWPNSSANRVMWRRFFDERVTELAECSSWNIVRSVPTGTFHFAENFWRKLLILRAGSWAEQWNQGVRLWKKCLLSRGSNVY